MADGFSVNLSRPEGRFVVSVQGDVDMATAPDLEKALAEATVAPGDLPVLVDLTATTFIDSSGLKILARSARQLGDRFTLVCPPANHVVTRVIDIVGFRDTIAITETL
jgi:anti-sigma B factor antagonist